MVWVFVFPVAAGPPVAVADVGPSWRCTGRASGLVTRSFRSSVCVMGVPIQRFLQDAFLDKWETVVRAVGDLDGVFRLQVRRLTLFFICLLFTCVAGQMFVDNERDT
jgi:hypothetical protein